MLDRKMTLKIIVFRAILDVSIFVRLLFKRPSFVCLENTGARGVFNLTKYFGLFQYVDVFVRGRHIEYEKYWNIYTYSYYTYVYRVYISKPYYNIRTPVSYVYFASNIFRLFFFYC